MMKVGVVFPQTEIGPDPVVVRDYAQTAEGLGYDYLLAYEHVLGANPDRPGGWQGPYTFQSLFHEPFVLFGYLAGLTQRIEFATGILILPQRQTALVAKQAAEVDVLSGGRLRLGVGVGWNPVEYTALGEDFSVRGRRQEEQVQLLRRLWTEELVTFAGEFHTVPDAGLNPMPVQRPIPLWFGGSADALLRRAARLGDGWMPNTGSAQQLAWPLETLRGYVAQAGRDPAAFGVDCRISLNRIPETDWAGEIAALRDLGISHLCVNTMGMGFKPQEHMAAIARFKEMMET